MRVCVVGGTGNISSSIVKLLLEVGHEVTVFNRGQAAGVPQGAKVIRGDRQDRPAFEKAMQDARFDAAIDTISYAAEDARSAVRAFRGVRHFIHCSTTCVYGVQYDWLPVTEDHPLRPIGDYGRNKVAAEAVVMEAYYRDGLPVTIMRPSSTYGPKWIMLRQVAWDETWVDRIAKGKPILVCGDGRAVHQWLHVEDAAPAFVFALGRERCIGQTYNVMRKEFASWADYHRTAMKVLGRQVELVGVPLANLQAARVPELGVCEDIFSYNTIYNPDKLMRDVPEFQPRISLEEGFARMINVRQAGGGLANSDGVEWEDRLIEQQRRVGQAGIV